jgi:glyoxylase-like metal-dependent hydrolase (beta-lactamase superfamily II)
VLVRDWLNANQIVLLGEHTVVVDTGYGRDSEQTLALLRAPQVLGARAPDLLVNTHCHADHMGGNARLARAYGCPIAIPLGEQPLIQRWDEEALWLSYADQRCERFSAARSIRAGESARWGDLDWLALAAPGHDAHALMYWCEEYGVLLSGDALWQSGFGVLLPGAGREERLHATRTTLESIAQLDVRCVIPGHGAPFSDIGAALERAHRRLDALAVDETRMVRSLLKTMFVFSLLDRRRLAESELVDYLSRVPLYRPFNERYLGLSLAELAQWLITELGTLGAVERQGGWLRPGPTLSQ